MIALAFCLSSSLGAQITPKLNDDNPRLQTVHWVQSQPIILTAMQSSGLMLLFEQGERIERVELANDQLLQVRVSADRDSLLFLPSREIDETQIQVITDRRTYPILFRTRDSLLAAYLVRIETEPDPSRNPLDIEPSPGGPTWSYRLRGDEEVRPFEIRDDAQRTFITYAPGQALPAVFAIGPTGEEETVNGYMRGDVYVIDRVYAQLVFRIDKERATARRNTDPDGDS